MESDQAMLERLARTREVTDSDAERLIRLAVWMQHAADRELREELTAGRCVGVPPASAEGAAATKEGGSDGE